MAIKDYDIVGSYNNQRVTSIDAERSVNVFEYIDPLGKKPKSLINTSGLIDTESDFTNVSNGYRAQFVFATNPTNNFEYDVVGNTFLRRDVNGNVNNLGTLTNTTAGYVGIDANTFQIIIVDGVNGYIFDTIASTFTKITDTSFPVAPIDVCYLDGFFIVANGNTNTFQLSSFNQGLVWGNAENVVTTNIGVLPNQLIIGASTIGGVATSVNYQTGIPVSLTLGTSGSLSGTGLATGVTYYTILVDGTHIKLATSYANAIAGIPVTITADITPTINLLSAGQLQVGSITSHPGNIVACRTLHRRLFLFSEYYTEVWENAGAGTNLPFRRNNSLLMEYGTPSIWSIAVSFDMMVFLAQDRGGLGSVMSVLGTQSIPISNRALDFQLSQYAANQAVSDCAGFLIKENGLIFYRMNFTKANHTFVYNVTLSNPSLEEGKLWHEEEILNGNRHPAQTHAYFNGINYVGNYLSPILYQVDSQTTTNAGEAIRRMRIGRPIVPDGYQRIRIDRFQIDLLQGQIATIEDTMEEEALLTELGDELDTEAGDVILAVEENVITSFEVPFVFLSISKDGGQTYGYLIKAPMGRVGDRTFRTLWRKLGTIPRGQAFVPKLEFFSATPFVLMGAAWVYEIMPE